MDGPAADQLHGLFTGESFVKVVAFRSEINFQSVNDVRLVIADENIVHGRFSSLQAAFIIPADP
jgi:hypothetical protein